MKLADLVFLLNAETKQNVTEHLGIPETRIILINNGVNTDIYHPLTETEKWEAKGKWNLQGKRVILQVGSVYENKGQLRSLEHMLSILKKQSDVVFAYAGGIVDDAYQFKIQEYALAHGVASQIRYLGMVTPGVELNKLYNIAEATILSSKYEGFSLVSVESCAAGIPVLVDRFGPIRLGAGSVCYDANCFEEVCRALVCGDTTEFRTAARDNAVQNYSWAKIASDYLTVFINRME